MLHAPFRHKMPHFDFSLLLGAARALRQGAASLSHTLPARDLRQRSNRAAARDVDWLDSYTGAGGDWARTEYGHYYAGSAPVYSAIKLRADALTRATAVVHRLTPEGTGTPAGPSHPVQRLLDRVNPWYTRGDLWRATEIYLNLWGTAFWALERDQEGGWEIWALRPDRVKVLPDAQSYIRGFVYQGRSGPVAYTPDEIVWLRYFNPMDEYAGLSPLAPARMAVDMGRDGLRYNRNFLRNSARPDFVLLTNESMNDVEVEEFYNRWEARHRGPSNPNRPAIASFVRDIKTLGFSHRDMEFIQGLRWSLEDVSRVFGVPKPLLSDLERATFANINASERMFWRNTMVPQIGFLEEQINRMLLPRLGYTGLQIKFDLSGIEALREDENSRVAREAQLLDRGVLTINEVRRSRGLHDVPWGDTWARAPRPAPPAQDRPPELSGQAFR